MSRATASKALRYHVYATAFHGGGLISSHRVAERALARSVKEQVGDCTCGCAAVVASAEGDVGTYIGGNGYMISSCVGELSRAGLTLSPYTPAL